MESFLLHIGEINIESEYLKSIRLNKEIIVGQKVAPELKILKMEGSKIIDPEIITIGNSRVNSFRANMFAPYRFYNFSRVTTNFSHYLSIVKKFDNLKMVIVILEPFQFRKIEGQKKGPFRIKRKSRTIKQIVKNFYTISKRDIFKLHETPSFFGINGHLLNRGIRSLDGSVYAGKQHLKTNTDQEKKFAQYKSKNSSPTDKDMFQYLDSDINPRSLELYRELVHYAEEKNITVVGITMPYAEEIQSTLNSNKKEFNLYHLLQTPNGQDQLRSVSEFYFNFSELEKLGSSNNEMIDRIHPSEKICARILLKMMENKAFEKIIPKIDTQYIRHKIESTPLPLMDIFSQLK